MAKFDDPQQIRHSGECTIPFEDKANGKHDGSFEYDVLPHLARRQDSHA